jgi:molybdopterin-guanine dinucleotide biosynthesis protein A
MENLKSAYILAGGKSSRMGEDKGLKLLHDKHLIQYVIDSLIPYFHEIKISTNNSEYNRFGYELVPDIFPEKGPMGGIYSALKNSPSNDIFITGCDMPCIFRSSIEHLLQQKNQSATVAVYKGKVQPLFGIYNRNLIPVLETKIEQNKLKMIELLQEIKAMFIEMNDEDVFLNINTLEDFKQLENKK